MVYKRDVAYRKNVANEILSTEKSYVYSLTTVIGRVNETFAEKREGEGGREENH
jgi:hypothetical protein